mmetsp:Transcript_45563/g.103238  ORF Transcript_45563/g.103238 Transcript_45563/m.103238 type:complete len:400 (+) Transcript_45563:1161-2360(+)
MVCSYAILLGITVENRDVDYSAVEAFFVLFFVFELGVRVYFQGTSYVFASAGTVVDTIIVLLGVADVVLSWVQAADGSSSSGIPHVASMRLMRVVRFLRVLRLTRVARAFRELRLLAQGLANSIVTLGWVMFLLVLVMYVCAIVLAEGFHADLDRHVGSSGETVRTFFGSLSKCMFTLFQILTLDSWSTIARNVLPFAPWAVVVMITYVIITSFAMLNVVTGVFVEQTQAAAHDDQHNILHAQMQHEDKQLRNLRSLFRQADKDNSGSVTAKEFTDLLEQGSVRAQLAKMGLSRHEAWGLFHILDVDNDGYLSLEEFLFGCIRLQAGVRALDIVSLQYELHKLHKGVDKCRRDCRMNTLNTQDIRQQVEAGFATLSPARGRSRKKTDRARSAPVDVEES